MDTRQKMAISGAGLIVAGIGLGIVGAALLVSATFAWTTRLVEKGADGFTANVEGASKTVGTVAGTLHRSFNEAKRAGLAEIKRSVQLTDPSSADLIASDATERSPHYRC